MEAIRRAITADDFEQATTLLWQYVAWVRRHTRFDPVVDQPALAAELGDLSRYFSGPDASLFLADRDGRSVGTVTMRCNGDGTVELKRMYVMPAARGSGLAGRLVDRVLDEAAHVGCRTVWLESLRGPMEAAIAIYRARGFVEVADRARTADLDGLIVMERSVVPLAIP